MSYALSAVLFRLGFSNLWRVPIYNYSAISSLYLYFKALFWNHKFILLTYKIIKHNLRVYVYFYYYRYKIFDKEKKKKSYFKNPFFLMLPKVTFYSTKYKFFRWLVDRKKTYFTNWFKLILRPKIFKKRRKGYRECLRKRKLMKARRKKFMRRRRKIAKRKEPKRKPMKAGRKKFTRRRRKIAKRKEPKRKPMKAGRKKFTRHRRKIAKRKEPKRKPMKAGRKKFTRHRRKIAKRKEPKRKPMKAGRKKFTRRRRKIAKRKEPKRKPIRRVRLRKKKRRRFRWSRRLRKLYIIKNYNFTEKFYEKLEKGLKKLVIPEKKITKLEAEVRAMRILQKKKISTPLLKIKFRKLATCCFSGPSVKNYLLTKLVKRLKRLYFSTPEGVKKFLVLTKLRKSGLEKSWELENFRHFQKIWTKFLKKKIRAKILIKKLKVAKKTKSLLSVSIFYLLGKVFLKKYFGVLSGSYAPMLKTVNALLFKKFINKSFWNKMHSQNFAKKKTKKMVGLKQRKKRYKLKAFLTLKTRHNTLLKLKYILFLWKLRFFRLYSRGKFLARLKKKLKRKIPKTKKRLFRKKKFFLRKIGKKLYKKKLNLTHYFTLPYSRLYTSSIQKNVIKKNLKYSTLAGHYMLLQRLIHLIGMWQIRVKKFVRVRSLKCWGKKKGGVVLLFWPKKKVRKKKNLIKKFLLRRTLWRKFLSKYKLQICSLKKKGRIHNVKALHEKIFIKMSAKHNFNKVRTGNLGKKKFFWIFRSSVNRILPMYYTRGWFYKNKYLKWKSWQLFGHMRPNNKRSFFRGVALNRRFIKDRLWFEHNFRGPAINKTLGKGFPQYQKNIMVGQTVGFSKNRAQSVGVGKKQTKYNQYNKFYKHNASRDGVYKKQANYRQSGNFFGNSSSSKVPYNKQVNYKWQNYSKKHAAGASFSEKQVNYTHHKNFFEHKKGEEKLKKNTLNKSFMSYRSSKKELEKDPSVSLESPNKKLKVSFGSQTNRGGKNLNFKQRFMPGSVNENLTKKFLVKDNFKNSNRRYFTSLSTPKNRILNKNNAKKIKECLKIVPIKSGGGVSKKIRKYYKVKKKVNVCRQKIILAKVGRFVNRVSTLKPFMKAQKSRARKLRYFLHSKNLLNRNVFTQSLFLQHLKVASKKSKFKKIKNVLKSYNKKQVKKLKKGGSKKKIKIKGIKKSNFLKKKLKIALKLQKQIFRLSKKTKKKLKRKKMFKVFKQLTFFLNEVSQKLKKCSSVVEQKNFLNIFIVASKRLQLKKAKLLIKRLRQFYVKRLKKISQRTGVRRVRNAFTRRFTKLNQQVGIINFGKVFKFRRSKKKYLQEEYLYDYFNTLKRLQFKFKKPLLKISLAVLRTNFIRLLKSDISRTNKLHQGGILWPVKVTYQWKKFFFLRKLLVIKKKRWWRRKYFYMYKFVRTKKKKLPFSFIKLFCAASLNFLWGFEFLNYNFKFRNMSYFNELIGVIVRRLDVFYWFLSKPITSFFYTTLIIAKLLNSAYFLNFGLHKIFLNVKLHYFILRNFLMLWKSFLFRKSGIRLLIAGKWFGKMRAKKKLLTFGITRRQTVSVFTDYHNTTVITKYGIFSLKLWIGDITL